MLDWKNRFTAPVRLKMYVMLTGEVRTKGNIHFNPKSPRFKEMPREDRFNPVFAFLVQHPEKGLLMLDTGLHHSFIGSKFGNFGRILGSIVRGRTESGKDICTQLGTIGVCTDDVRYVLLSHLHLDHPSGLSYFAGSSKLKIFVDREELKSAEAPFSFLKGYVKKHLEGVDFQEIPYGPGAPPFEQACDFFGDGSVFVVRTSGHTNGHSSVILNAADGPILLTFDAVHRRSNINEGIPPSGNYSEALSTLRNIETFMKQFPQTRVVFGHDPDQLEKLILAPRYYS